MDVSFGNNNNNCDNSSEDMLVDHAIRHSDIPEIAVAVQNTTRHFRVLDGNGSNLVGGIYGALVMKGKELGTIVEQMPCRLYESSDISIPHKLHDNSN